MKKFLKAIELNNMYYIGKYDHTISFDYTIAKFLNIPIREYRSVLINQLNAYEIDSECFFYTLPDAEKAIQYLEDKYLVMYKLSEVM